jgi:nitronate monooxygenase
MAGVSTPQLAAAVSHAGGLGSIAIGASTVSNAQAAIKTTRELVGPSLPFAVNVFCHPSPRVDVDRQVKWLDALRPAFQRLGAADQVPNGLEAIYTTFDEDKSMVEMLIAAQVPVVSFHFGLPSQATIEALRSSGAILLATATNLEEAQIIEAAELDGIVAQGYEAGGHRGMFDLAKRDDKLGTLALTRILVRHCKLPVIAAGGIMDGAGIAAVLKLGAIAAQLGTAFVACPESAASEAYKRDLLVAQGTEMVDVISGRPARTILNQWTTLVPRLNGLRPPDYPIAYDAGKKLHAAGISAGEHGYGAQWAGQGVTLTRALPAKGLMRELEHELKQCI